MAYQHLFIAFINLFMQIMNNHVKYSKTNTNRQITISLFKQSETERSAFQKE